MFYRHVKQMVCGHTSYFLCTQVSGDCTDISNISITHSVADLTPEKTGKISGLMVIETKLEVKKLKIISSSIICIFFQTFNVNFMENTL